MALASCSADTPSQCVVASIGHPLTLSASRLANSLAAPPHHRLPPSTAFELAAAAMDIDDEPRLPPAGQASGQGQRQGRCKAAAAAVAAATFCAAQLAARRSADPSPATIIMQAPLVFGTIRPGDSAAAVAAGVAAGNIMRQAVDAEVMDLPEVRLPGRMDVLPRGRLRKQRNRQPGWSIAKRGSLLAFACCLRHRQTLAAPSRRRACRRPARSTCASSRS